MNTQEIESENYLVKENTISDLKGLLLDIKGSIGQGKFNQKIKELEEELKQIKKIKKYGLIWEDKIEEFDKNSINKLPVLEEIKDRDIIENNGKSNILIEGDNYHSLSVLSYTHKGKIDVIYIDPPYNRGGDFIYNDIRIEKDDKFKHSMWLSFMNKRLVLAKRLLSENGILIISIDEYEYAGLNLLCSEIFGEEHIETMIWRKSGEGRDGKMKNTTTFRKDHEYIIFCFNGSNTLNKIKEEPNFQNIYNNPDNDPRGPFKAGSISRKESASNERHKNYYTVISPTGKKFTRQFDIAREDFEKLNTDFLLNNEGKKVSRIYWGKDDNAVPSLKIFINEEREITPYSILLNKGTTTNGTTEVSEILQKDCSKMRPKPTSLISTLIQIASNNESIILDFFAGTGTTGHSTEIVNEKFGGNRKFILCTDNKENICSDFCYPRIKNIIKGNLKYLKTAFIDKVRGNDDLRKRMVARCTELLCLKENIWEIYNPKLKKEIKGLKKGSIKIFKRDDKYLAILFDMFYFDEFKELLKGLDKEVAIYVFSNYKLLKEDFEGLKIPFEIEEIPDPILEVYAKIFEF